MPRCELTGVQFKQSEIEQLILERLGLPEPRQLPAKRLQHRLTFRNERALYKRPSSLSGKNIISIYAPESPYLVYAADEWWSDKWDGLEYGQPFDFTRPFFEQYYELQLKVPRTALFNVNSENSDYCQQAYNNKNCYLCTVLKDCQDSMYVSHSNRLRDCFDCDYLQDSELCFDCLDSDKLYGCVGCDNCQNSSELYFCNDCIGCSSCLGCWGLRNQRYCVANQQLTRESFAQLLAELKLSNRTNYLRAAQEYRAKISANNSRSDFNINAEDCTGNHLINAKDCHSCFDSFQIESCSDCTWIFESHHCADVYGMGTSEWVYESIGVENLNTAAFNTFVSDSSNAYYSDLCFYCRDIFGCVGLKKNRNCILNIEYKEGEYQALRSRIIDHMRETDEWGRFFPGYLSPFAYNESVAQERFPFDRDGAIESGYRWREDDQRMSQAPTGNVPIDSIDGEEDLPKKTFRCNATGFNFRLTQQEIDFCRTNLLPLPEVTPEHRYRLRIARREV